MSSIFDCIFDWLETKRVSAIDALADAPEESFDAILNYRGPYPEGVHPRDVHDIHLVNLLTLLLKRTPSVLSSRSLSSIESLKRYTVINAAIGADVVAYRNLILTGLRDRSIYVKTLVLDAISRHSELRTPHALSEVTRLLSVQSIADSDYDRAHVQAALDSFTNT